MKFRQIFYNKSKNKKFMVDTYKKEFDSVDKKLFLFHPFLLYGTHLD